MLIVGLIALRSEVSVQEIDRLARAKDVNGLKQVVQLPAGTTDPFGVLRTGGAYDVGRFGWSAVPLESGKERFVVISTALTSEDVGEILLRRVDGKLVYVPETDGMGVQVVRHDFRAMLVPDKKRVDIVDDFSFSSKTGKPFVFRMSPNYKVSSITSGGKTVPFTQGSGLVLLSAPTGASTYRVVYSGIVDLPQYAGTISPKEATLVNDYWYPMIARQPARYAIEAHAPKGWLIVGQGERLPVEPESDSIAKFRMDVPVVYYSLSAGPYKTFSQRIASRTYQVWAPNLTQDQMRIQTELYAPILDFYSKSFGTYPFSQWGALQSPGYGGGALEAYSYATYGGGMPSEDAHEPAHTWWGGLLNNTYLGSFWNESFAVYSDGLFHRNAPLGRIADRQRAFTSQGDPQPDYARRAIEGSSAFTGPIGSSLGYGKGAKVLGMLEQLIGTDAMISTMREWVKVDSGKAVDWPDFERVALRMNPKESLKTFFDDWLRKPGFANIEVDEVRYEGGMVKFRVGFVGEAYRIPLKVMIQDTKSERQFATVDVKGPGTYSIPSKSKPTLVSIDPLLRVLRKAAPNEALDTIDSNLSKLRRYTDPKHADYLHGLTTNKVQSLGDDLTNLFIVGHPDSTPHLKELCALAGFKVNGDELTYRDVTVNLNKGGAVAILDVPGKGRCAIGLGKYDVYPSFGVAKTAIFDEHGRFLAGETQPKIKGDLTFKL